MKSSPLWGFTSGFEGSQTPPDREAISDIPNLDRTLAPETLHLQTLMSTTPTRKFRYKASIMIMIVILVMIMIMIMTLIMMMLVIIMVAAAVVVFQGPV